MGPRDGMDISVSCRIFWLGDGDAWKEIAISDGMESTHVVRGSGGMESPSMTINVVQLLCNPSDWFVYFVATLWKDTANIVSIHAKEAGEAAGMFGGQRP